MNTTKINRVPIDEITLRKKVTNRGGGIEISLDRFGLKGHRMAAYQNYLGGGILGKVCVNDTINTSTPFVDEDLAKKLAKIGEQLKKHYFELTNPDSEWESQAYEQNQNMPESGY